MQDAVKTVVALGLCFGIPYAMDKAISDAPSSPSVSPAGYSSGGRGSPGMHSASQATPLYTPGATAPEAQAFAPTPQGMTPPQAVAERLEGPKFEDFSEVFRFDVTIAWLMNRWSRVSTAAREYHLQGYRVALMTGTKQDDIAGALTYYFTTDHQMAKITFVGATGDPRRLVATLEILHGLEMVIGNVPGEYLYEIRRVPGMMGYMRIRPGEVVTSDNPWSRYRVELSIERAASRPW